MEKREKTKGFSLTEVLVVIGVIGFLSVIFVGYNMWELREDARNAQRYSDYSSIEVALRLYKDLYGEYPSTGSQWWTVCPEYIHGGKDVTGANGYVPNLAPEFIPVLPEDPSGCPSVGGAVKGYIYRSNGTDYKFASDWLQDHPVKCEPGEKFADAIRPSVDSGPGSYYFCSISTPGAANW